MITALHLEASNWGAIVCASFVGLFLGSALNLLVIRLPKQMQRDWEAQCHESIATQAGSDLPLNLPAPQQSCQHRIQIKDVMPLLSFALLRGHCRYCAQPLSWREPIVEVLTATLFAFCVWRWGISVQALCAVLFSCSLLALALIDWDTSLLPDAITQPLLWSGLIASALNITAVPLHQALAGTVIGYGFLWLLYWAFKLCTGKEGMGFGDFKLTAAMGAWLGVGSLMPLLLIAALTGAVFGLVQKLKGVLGPQGHFPFGPFLSFAGVLVLFQNAFI